MPGSFPTLSEPHPETEDDPCPPANYGTSGRGRWAGQGAGSLRCQDDSEMYLSSPMLASEKLFLLFYEYLFLLQMTFQIT